MSTSEPAVAAPVRRSGRQCGYDGREQLHAANKALGKALTALARDSDPESRRTGAALAAEVTQYLAGVIARADAATSRSKRIAADLERRMPRIVADLETARTRLHRDVERRKV